MKTITTKTPVKARPRMPFADVMSALQKAGSEQTRKIYLRHGAKEPMFGVDHELAMLLWQTGNLDARNLAVKVVNPTEMTLEVLDEWARWDVPRTCGAYVAEVTSEGPHAISRVKSWITAQIGTPSLLAQGRARRPTKMKKMGGTALVRWETPRLCRGGSRGLTYA